MTSRENHARLGERKWVLYQGAADFFFFQNRGYPRQSALEWVGNLYQFRFQERQVLHRGVFSQREALQRHSKWRRGSDWIDDWLVVDGHNVQITIESFILDRPLLIANDGALRDLAGQSAQFRLTEVSEMAMDILFRSLEALRPNKVLFLFDAPLSHSGLLADKYRHRLAASNLRGEARAVPVPEKEFPYHESVIASSDQAVIEAAARPLDLARLAIDAAGTLQPIADFSSLICTGINYPCPVWVPFT